MSNDFMRVDARGITTPITKSGRVVYNAQRDYIDTHRRRHNKGRCVVYRKDVFGNAENHSIQQFELCFKRRKPHYIRQTPNDTDIKVFSSCNGINVRASDVLQLAKDMEINVDNETDVSSDDAAFEQGRKIVLNHSIEFAGVASNRAIYDQRNEANEEYLALQTGGMTTIYNNGNGVIHAGDIVMWGLPCLQKSSTKPELPCNRIPGVPRTKTLFSTIRYDPSTKQGLENVLVDTMYATWDPENIPDEGLRATDPEITVEVVLENIFSLQFELQRHVIGKAMSTARPGEPFDIFLGHYTV